MHISDEVLVKQLEIATEHPEDTDKENLISMLFLLSRLRCQRRRYEHVCF